MRTTPALSAKPVLVFLEMRLITKARRINPRSAERLNRWSKPGLSLV
jgi:hypothetical protein